MEDVKNYIDSATTNLKNDIVGGLIDGVKNSFVEGAKWLSLVIIDSSYTICLTLAMCGLIAYLSGYKKGARVVTISIIIFVVLQAIKVVLL